MINWSKDDSSSFIRITKYIMRVIVELPTMVARMRTPKMADVKLVNIKLSSGRVELIQSLTLAAAVPLYKK